MGLSMSFEKDAICYATYDSILIFCNTHFKKKGKL